MSKLTILSTSAISAFKACPTRYRYQYGMGIRPIEEVENRRMGSSWHEGLEIMGFKPEQPCPRCEHPAPECPICQGSGFVDDPLDALTRAMNKRYSDLFPGMPKNTKEIERATVLYALFAYKYHYEDRPIEVITTELPFRIPLIDPKTRKAIPGVVIDGKLDKLIRTDGTLAVMEHKSTSDDLAPESDYWGHLRLDTQTTLYTYAIQRLQADGLLEPWNIKANDPPIGTILYDVWRKPAIKPKKLSQADTAKFVETGRYFDREFEVTGEGDQAAGSLVVFVDGEPAEVEQLKKGFAIRETPDMFGCRLFDEINQQPDRYFARRLLARTSLDMERFEHELYALYSAVESKAWFHNEYSCDNRGKCDYCQFCFTGQEIDPKHPPAGFINIFDKEKK